MPPKKAMSNRDFLLMITPVVLALLIVAFTGGLYIAQRIANEAAERQSAQAPVDDAASGSIHDDTVIPDAVEVVANQDAIVKDEKTLSIAWLPLDQQKIVEVNAAFQSALGAAVYPGDFQWLKDNPDQMKTWITTTSLGTVKGGMYDGYTLQLNDVSALSLGDDTAGYYYVLLPINPTDKVVIARPSFTEHIEAVLSQTLRIDYGVTIPELNTTASLTIQNGTVLNLQYVGAHVNSETLHYPVAGDVAYTAINGETVYLRHSYIASTTTSQTDLFYTIPADGRLAWYDLQIPIWAPKGDRAQELTVQRTGGGTFKGTYIKGQLGGCGFQSLTHISTVPQDPGKTELFGYIGNTKVYALTVAGLADRDSDRTAWLTWNQDKTGQDYDNLIPYLYVQDSLGRWTELTNTLVPFPAECGKPVIYLYPPKTTDISVKLAPVGGFSKVEPAYNDGWRVTASPDGSLVNKDDGKTYPYLFWEGRGGLYTAPEQYWVLKRDEISTMMPKILGQLGLNDQETKDFMEFWGPRMQAAPYYKVGFHGNRVMDALAPLTVSPAPKSTLRILMDYTELQAPIKANPPRISAPFKRSGFTVVEWGGVLR